jgi:hypothetical protein
MLSLALGINLGGAAVGLYRPSLSPELRADASADVICAPVINGGRSRTR